MSSRGLQSDREIIRRYTGQPEYLPLELRAKIEKEWGGEPVQLYGLADLDASGKTTNGWIALGPSKVAVVRPDGRIDHIERSRIRKVEERPSLSATTLVILGEPDEPALGMVRYSYRQQNAIGGIAFVLKQATEGNDIRPGGNADTTYADAVALPMRNAQGSLTSGRFSVVRRLAGLVARYKWSFLAGTLANVMMTVLMLAPPTLTQRIIDNSIRPFEDGQVSRDEAWKVGLVLMGTLLVIFILRELFMFIRLRFLSIMGERVAGDLRRQLYDHLHKLSISYFSRHQTGSIISRVGSDTDRVWDFIAFGAADLIFAVVLLIGLSVRLIWMDWQLGLILVLPTPLLFLVLYWMGRRMHRVFLRIWQKWSSMTSTVSDTVPGIRIVQAFNQSDYERDRFRKRNEAVVDEAMRAHRIWTGIWPLVFFGVNFLIVVVWAVAVPRMLQFPGWQPMTLGTFVAFLFYMNMYAYPLEMFGFLTRIINRSLSSAQRVFEVLDTEPEIKESQNPVRLRPLKGHVVFQDVTFGYDPVRQILKGISFEVEPGEMIGLVGPSGAGKTTVVNLIARFYDITSGKILVDGHDITTLEIGDFRSQIGMVLQDPYLFHGSVMDNIRYGKHEATEDEVIEAARAANAHDFICKLSHGYDTLVGERGHNLSGGERQRISIARAVLHNPRVLILDEATSSVDTETERKIQEAIDRLVQGRTVIAIAHRLSTLSRANRLFVMEDGKLVETGTHQELLNNPEGLYYKLHNIQRELHEMWAV